MGEKGVQGTRGFRCSQNFWVMFLTICTSCKLISYCFFRYWTGSVLKFFGFPPNVWGSNPTDFRGSDRSDVRPFPWRILTVLLYEWCSMDPINISPVMLALIYQHHGSVMGYEWWKRSRKNILCRKLFMVAKKVSLGNISPGFFCPLPQIIQKYNLIQSRSQEDRRATNPTNIAANHVFSLAWITR